MTQFSIPDLEDRSGVDKQPGETVAEYLRRVGQRTDLPPEDVEAVIRYTDHQQFSPDPSSMDAADAPIDEFLRAAEELGESDQSTSRDAGPRADPSEQQERRISREMSGPPPDTTLGIGTDDETSYVYPVLLALGIVLIVAAALVVGGGQIPGTGVDLLSTDTDVDETETNEPTQDTDTGTDESPTDNATGTDESTQANETEADVVDSAAEAEGQLAVTDMAVDSSLEPDEEFIELTNTGDTALDMSDWTVRDREGGAVDARGVDPVTFPDGFVLEPGESVRIVTAPGQDTDDTVHWGYDTRNWHEDGDVIIVLDGNGEVVLRHQYGSPP
ncbi:lamin tail domain-containing protein [Halalkalicoccus salilacus]|uniref:lamin tail domain-containing protein n=1 Tax=Halalkalicoccus salilacus TaxID=3117459 RepID=UPI00300EF317